ncbi:MAG: ATP-binding protein [Parvibaculum sp.]|uniref:AlbA family DNA-binding domain-containing protein n=1 Tax=Parvibaculum sp. TaxID=2024848 RepID=UPI0032ED16DF
MSKRQRTMTDKEIGLAKAMLNRGLRNDEIHFYFNRADRLISSGRIAQIKKNKYGASIAEASPEELNAFLLEWETLKELASNAHRSLPRDTRTLRSMFKDTGAGWIAVSSESDQIEYKKSFQLRPDHRFSDIVRSIAGLANNKGGYIFIGVEDRTFKVTGLSDENFLKMDPAEINRTLASALDPVPHVTKSTIHVGGLDVGVLNVEKHGHPPVVAIKNIASDIKEGAIYYRYVGETRSIKSGELHQIIAAREQGAIANFFKRMSRVAAGSDATLNLDTGEVTGKNARFVIDESLLPRIQFLREGNFRDTDGDPTLKLVGDVETIGSSSRAKTRIIRDTVTPDAVVRNFLTGGSIEQPIQYIHAHAHCQRRWLPLWYYVKLSGAPIAEIVRDMRSLRATYPSNRDLCLRRLQKKESAFKAATGKHIDICKSLANGNFHIPRDGPDDLAFANAVIGLPNKMSDAEVLKPILLAALERTESDIGGSRRSYIYRAACRLDELLYR